MSILVAATANQAVTPATGTGILNDAVSTFVRLFNPSGQGIKTITLIENKGLYVQSDAASTAGDGTAEVYISYRIITL